MAIEDKVIAITGASSGIGKAIALDLAKRGTKLILGARSERPLKAVAEEIARADAQVSHICIDVARRADLDRLVGLARERFGRLDVLVSSAGAMPIGRMEELAVDDWEHMVDVNIKGVLYGIAAALPVFLKQGSGHFINIASTAARKTVPNQAVYSGTKAAVAAISDGLRQELAGKCRVTVVYPGYTATNLLAHVKNPELRSQLESAAKEYAMSPHSVAAAVAYAIDQTDDVNIGEIVLRSAAQP
jgi:NADP-dependent 3-hydroxy acid dehydrogenase YdfG